MPVAAGSRLPDLVFMLAGGLLGAAGGALQAASRTLLVHQAEGQVALGAGLRPLRPLRQGHRLHRPGADRARHRRHRVAAARGQSRDPALPDRARAAILGQNRQRAVQEPSRMIRRALALCLALAALDRARRGADREPLFGAKGTPSPHPPYSIGAAVARLPRRRRPAARERPDLAGDAARPQPPLGQPADDRLHRGPEPDRDQGRLARPLRRRHRPGARRPGQGPCQPPDRPRRRHLVTCRRRASTSAAPSASGSRRSTSARADQRGLNANWTPSHAYILEAAARDPRVNRIFVTAPVKLAMCADAGRGDAAWLRKIRPWWNHHDHFHVRLNCPRGARAAASTRTRSRPATAARTRSGGSPTRCCRPTRTRRSAKPTPPLRLADLPPQCAEVLTAR